MRSPRRPPQFRTWRMSDGYELHGRLWPASGPEPRTPVLYLHGIQSHGGWFEWSASVLAESGRPVLLPDRRGSGRNRPDRGDVTTAERWLADLDELAEFSKREFETPDLDVLGVSWGGKLALAWALARPQPLRELLLIAPGLVPAVDVGLVGRLRIVAALLTTPQRHFEIPLSEPALFTETIWAKDFIESDPDRLTHVTARFLYHSHRLDRRLRAVRPGSVTVGATLWLAEKDRIIRNDRSRRLLERLCSGEPDIRVFSDASHTLEFEPDAEPLETGLRAWAARAG